MARVLLGLGSNVGDALTSLQRAASRLNDVLCDVQASSIYRTVPMYLLDQPPFLNAAISGEFDGGPMRLLKQLKELEYELGRTPRQRNGPREIDIDLLAYGAIQYIFQDGLGSFLAVPHPKSPERRFVLQPLADIAPDFNLPGLGTVRELLKQTNEQAADVVRLEDALLPIHGAR